MNAAKENPAPIAVGSRADFSKHIASNSTAPIDRLLSCLGGVKEVGAGRWIARCPAHDDKRPSLSIREVSDGRVLVHCFAGCSAIEVLGAVGLSLADLFEKPAGHFLPKARVTFPALPILKALSLEATVVFICGAALLAGEPFDRDRLLLALDRIDAGLRVAEGRA